SKSSKRPLLSCKLGPDDWTQECKQAFRDLKAALVEEVLLAHPDFSKSFILSVDVSTAGLGAVLFTVWTDNNPLKYILTKPRLDACEQRWVAQLAPFDFDIQYIPRTKNVVADALSREPFVAHYSTLLKQAANFKKDDVQNMFRLSVELPEMRDVNVLIEPGDTTVKANPVPLFNHDELLTEQVNDAVVGRVKREKVHESRGTLRILRQWGKLTTRLGIVYRVSKHPVTKQKACQYVVPESLRMAVLKGIHDDAGHQGQQRSLGLARQRFYWDTMEKDVKDYVHN
ncbi:hypothetical protein M9458_051454, partial [Cirrhinus mrigala]